MESSTPPTTYVPWALCTAYVVSATAHSPSPATSNIQAPPGRQPDSAITATEIASSTMSPTGYASVVATAIAPPAAPWTITSKASVATTAAVVEAAIAPSSTVLVRNARIRWRTSSTSPAYANG